MRQPNELLPPSAPSADQDEPTLIFLHVPKTAGTTLNRIIDSQYNPFRIYSVPGGYRNWSIEKFKRLPEQRRRDIRVLRGHMGFGLHRYFPQPTTYLTMLREPVSQVVSSYYYAMSNRFHPLHGVVASRGLTLSDFLDLAPWGNNLQCKLIGGMSMAEVRPRESLEAASRGEKLSAERFAGRHCSEDILAAAKHNLETRFSVVGLTEYFAESVALMALKYGWEVPSYQNFRRSSKRPSKDPLDVITRSRIEHYNSYDMELYIFGQALFRRAITNHHDEIQGNLDKLRSTPSPGKLRAFALSSVAWGRFGLSLLRSSI